MPLFQFEICYNARIQKLASDAGIAPCTYIMHDLAERLQPIACDGDAIEMTFQ